VRLTSGWRRLRAGLLTLVIAADLFALWVWAVRPNGDYSGWLGLIGLPEAAPWFRLLAWSREENAPRTPSGCISLFETQELLFCGVLLVALVLLVVLLAATRRGSRLGVLLTSTVRIPRRVSVRFRVTTALAAIAILALYLGWEINAWRTWRLRSSYLIKAAIAASDERSSLMTLESMRKALARLDSDPLPIADLSQPEYGYYRSRAALAASRAVAIDSWKREIPYRSALAEAHAARKRKYEWAASNLPAAVAPDPPLPRWNPEPGDARATGDYARVIAFYNEQTLAYPDYVEPYLLRAWIYASCPDARFRDGPRAVEAATRACELTNWKDAGALASLAAAFAESGNFAKAVKWQEKVVALTSDPRNAYVARERLTLFKSGKPYRQKSRFTP
jgi:hypothetical protein